jgi:hypothetical protein
LSLYVVTVGLPIFFFFFFFFNKAPDRGLKRPPASEFPNINEDGYYLLTVKSIKTALLLIILKTLLGGFSPAKESGSNHASYGGLQPCAAVLTLPGGV